MSGRLVHYAGGLALGAAVDLVGTSAGAWGRSDAVALAAVAAVTAGGELSPDVDQFGWWRLLDRLLPDEALGAGGPLQHRGITHWIAWPPLMAGGWAVLLSVFPGLPWWLGFGVALGWASHLLLDSVFGRAVRSPDGRVVVRAGVPTMPWWRHRGGAFRSGGLASSVTGVLLVACVAGGLFLRR